MKNATGIWQPMFRPEKYLKKIKKSPGDAATAVIFMRVKKLRNRVRPVIIPRPILSFWERITNDTSGPPCSKGEENYPESYNINI